MTSPLSAEVIMNKTIGFFLFDWQNVYTLQIASAVSMEEQ